MSAGDTYPEVSFSRAGFITVCSKAGIYSDDLRCG